MADHVQRELTDIIRNEMRDPRIGMFSINEVRISRDLAFADVYVSMLEAGTQEEHRDLESVLDHAAGYLRTLLAARSTMRTTPRLRFHYDETVERGASLERLIHDAVAEDLARNSGAPQPGAGRPEGEE